MRNYWPSWRSIVFMRLPCLYYIISKDPARTSAFDWSQSFLTPGLRHEVMDETSKVCSLQSLAHSPNCITIGAISNPFFQVSLLLVPWSRQPSALCVGLCGVFQVRVNRHNLHMFLCSRHTNCKNPRLYWLNRSRQLEMFQPACPTLASRHPVKLAELSLKCGSLFLTHLSLFIILHLCYTNFSVLSVHALTHILLSLQQLQWVALIIIKLLV